MPWKPDPWPSKTPEVAALGNCTTSGVSCSTAVDARLTFAAPDQSNTKSRAQKRKCCDISHETSFNADVVSTKGSLCSAISKAPQALYTIAGETLPGARVAIQASGALWSTDSWIEQPSSWEERRVSVIDPESRRTGITRTKYDKCFCAEWINNSQLAVSTKCGHVLRVDRHKRTYQEVETVGEQWVEPPIDTEEDLHRYRIDRGGIHSLSANHAKHLLACSGCRDDDNNVYVLDLLTDKWKTVKQGRGHEDWVFTLSWISDHAFITGGRDKSVLLWNPLANDEYSMEPVARYNVHRTKVRCSSFDRETERLVTMDVSGQVHLWDGVGSGDMKVVRRFQIPAVYKEECTCAYLSDNMLMAGAKHAVTIYDPRRPVSILSVPLARMGYCHAFTQGYPNSVAARSINVHGCMISIGLSTGGTIICLDKRMMGGGVFESKVAQDPDDWCKTTQPELVKESARALTACITPYPELPGWVQSKCHSDVLFAGIQEAPRSIITPQFDPPVKVARYNLRQRPRIKQPPQFASTVPLSKAAEGQVDCQDAQATLSDSGDPASESTIIGPDVPSSTHVLDLSKYVTPKAILKQPHGEVHVDDVVSNGFQIENAIFSHAWSPDGCAMFSCGGPLAMGVRGCYMALWC